MDRVTERLRLDASQRRRLEDVLRQNEGRRRALAREAGALRQQLTQAADDPGVSDAELQRMLDQMADLRRRELDLWRDEQHALATVLNPRQRARFMVMRLQFTEMVQRARRERRGGAFGEPPS
ncbi:MAG: Spy/CpxP family protein refolding chaperone [Gemmatimonadetes bacterium]|nr:Spy/CpxP family protein refolding chaperone [Gemmatimonadota bacterium]